MRPITYNKTSEEFDVTVETKTHSIGFRHVRSAFAYTCSVYGARSLTDTNILSSTLTKVIDVLEQWETPCLTESMLEEMKEHLLTPSQGVLWQDLSTILQMIDTESKLRLLNPVPKELGNLWSMSLLQDTLWKVYLSQNFENNQDNNQAEFEEVCNTVDNDVSDNWRDLSESQRFAKDHIWQVQEAKRIQDLDVDPIDLFKMLLPILAEDDIPPVEYSDQWTKYHDSNLCLDGIVESFASIEVDKKVYLLCIVLFLQPNKFDVLQKYATDNDQRDDYRKFVVRLWELIGSLSRSFYPATTQETGTLMANIELVDIVGYLSTPARTPSEIDEYGESDEDYAPAQRDGDLEWDESDSEDEIRPTHIYDRNEYHSSDEDDYGSSDDDFDHRPRTPREMLFSIKEEAEPESGLTNSYTSHSTPATDISRPRSEENLERRSEEHHKHRSSKTDDTETHVSKGRRRKRTRSSASTSASTSTSEPPKPEPKVSRRHSWFQ